MHETRLFLIANIVIAAAIGGGYQGVVGNITIGGAVEKVLQFADKVSSLAENGAKMVIVPMDNIAELATVPTTVLSKCDVPFYNNAQVLLQKALE